MNADFGIVNTDALGLLFYNYEMTIPEVQEHKLSVPGRDGEIDLTSAYGKEAYLNRTVTLFLCDTSDMKRRRETQSAITTAIHGKRNNLVISDSPLHTIKGRWGVEVEELPNITKYTITGDCYPFRNRGTHTYRINAAGGVTIALEGGDKHTRPVIEVASPAVIEYEGRTWNLNPGAYYIEDLYFHSGVNYLHIDTYPTGGSVTWTDLKNKNVTWAELGTKRLSEWKWGTNPPQEQSTWADLKNKNVTWKELGTKPLIEWQHPVDTTNEIFMVYIQYDREDF